jgi:hypothetical protein
MRVLSYAMLTACCALSMASADVTVTAFNRVHQHGGTRTVDGTYSFPASMDGFNAIKMSYTLECPDGGCDPWDRFACVKVKKNGTEYEIGRYMTPYGRGYGWSQDVTEYAPLLSGSVTLSSFIDTWVNPGWLVTVKFTFVSGARSWDEVLVRNLWVNYNCVYGDPANRHYPAQRNEYISPSAQKVRLRIVNTGHGQGNSENAAEFSHKTHKVIVNGTVYNQDLWRYDCASNPCQPQNGTWQYERAGWCPGSDVTPSIYDITSKVSPGAGAALGYELAGYENFCRPSNSACQSGATCSDCNYNTGGHTEPHYKISSQLITYITYTNPKTPAYALLVKGGSGNGVINAASQATITAATPADGRAFSHWSGEGVAFGNSKAATTSCTMPAWSTTIGNGTYRLIAKHSGKALTVADGSTAAGAAIQQSTHSGSDSQRFAIQSLGSGIYTITNCKSGKIVEVSGASTDDGAAVKQWDSNQGDNQRWRIINLRNGDYRLENVKSGKVLDVSSSSTADGAKIQQWYWNGSDAQKWLLVKEVTVEAVYTYSMPSRPVRVFVLNGSGSGTYAFGSAVDVGMSTAPQGEEFAQWRGDTRYLADSTAEATTLSLPMLPATVADGVFEFVSVNSGKALDLEKAGTADGTRFWQRTLTDASSQRFVLTKTDSNGYLIKNCASGKYLDVANASMDNGASIHQWSYHGGAAQRWRLAHLGGGIYKVENVNSGKVVDIDGVSLRDSAYAHQWGWVDGPNQKWLLYPVLTLEAVFQPTVSTAHRTASLPRRFDVGIGANGLWYSIPALGAEGGAAMELTLYGCNGRQVYTLSRQTLKAGYYSIPIAGLKRSVSPGVYFWRMQAGPFNKTVKWNFAR